MSSQTNSEPRICSKAKCRHVLQADEPYKTCAPCRTSAAKSMANGRKRKRENKEAQLEKASKALVQLPPTQAMYEQTGNAGQDAPAPHSAGASFANMPFGQEEENEDVDITVYTDAQKMLESLRHHMKHHDVHFHGQFLLPLDPLISDRVRTQMTVEEVWKVTGYRFKVHEHQKQMHGHKIILFCCQDDRRKRKAKPTERDDVKHREHVTMRRYQCHSKLIVACRDAGNGNRLVRVRLAHREPHAHYIDVGLPPEATAIIRENVEWSTPAAILPQVKAAFPHLSSAQVNFAWTAMSEAYWKRAPGQMESAEKLLRDYAEDGDIDVFSVPTVDGVEQICFGLRKVAESLRDKIVEIAIDATYNTNSHHLELYSVMAECDNTGVPLTYCLLSTANSIEQGKRKMALQAWVERVRDVYGVRPRFVHSDKDMAEIATARAVWDAKIQLCWWHLRKAVRERLAKRKLSTTPYEPLRAHTQFAFIDKKWAPSGRADRAEYEGGAPDDKVVEEDTCANNPNMLLLRLPRRKELDLSLKELAAKEVEAPLMIRIPARTTAGECEIREEEEVRREFCPPEIRDRVVQLMESHYCAHPFIPGYSAPTSVGIRHWAVQQMYELCRKYDLPELWAYLWENWYREGRWELWARSSNSKEISRLKTTMIMESHWRRIKKDFLHHFHRPRIDILIWIVVKKLAPLYYLKLDILLMPVELRQRHRELGSWRKEFKRIWRKSEVQPINDEETAQKYRPDVRKWVCTCPHFVRSRFLVCKHLVQCVHPVPPQFFVEVSRSRVPPFWSHATLVPIISDEVAGAPRQGGPPSCDTEEEDDEGIAGGDEDMMDMDDEDWNTTTGSYEQRLDAVVGDIKAFLGGIEYQKQFRDGRFLATLEQRGASFLRLARECLAVERQSNTSRGNAPLTWGKENSSAMFYRTRPRPSDNH